MSLEPRSDFYGKHVEFYNETFDTREGVIIEVNGNLTLVEDEWGEPVWLAPHEIKRSL